MIKNLLTIAPLSGKIQMDQERSRKQQFRQKKRELLPRIPKAWKGESPMAHSYEAVGEQEAQVQLHIRQVN